VPRSPSRYVASTPVRPPVAPGRGELGTSLQSIGEPYVPRTATEKQAWGHHVKRGLGGLLSIADKVGASPEDVDNAIAALGFREMYDMSLGEGV